MRRSRRYEVDDDPPSERTPPPSGGAVPTEAERLRKRERARGRVRDLIARAVHEGTAEEEARTSAIIAVRLLHAEQLLEPEPAAAAVTPVSGVGSSTPSPFAGGSYNPWTGVRYDHHGRRLDPATLWRAEAAAAQRRLHAFASAMVAVLRNGKIGLAVKAGRCMMCTRAYDVGDTIVWKRKRAEAAHYVCCVVELENRQVAV